MKDLLFLPVSTSFPKALTWSPIGYVSAAKTTSISINKRFQERLSDVQPGETRETLDGWVQEIYSGFSAFQVVPFLQDHTAIADNPERVRLVIIHYDKEYDTVGGGDRLNFAKALFTKTSVHESP